jgi:hypothetical protein
MPTRRTTLAYVPAGLLALAGCAPRQQAAEPAALRAEGPPGPPAWARPRDMRLMLKGAAAAAPMDRQTMAARIEEIMPRNGRSDRQLVDAILLARDRLEPLPALRGPGGMLYWVLVEAADAWLDATGRDRFTGAIRITTQGLIDAVDPLGDVGYRLNADGSGHLSVTMTFTALLGNQVIRAMAYDIRTDVAPGGFAAIPRDETDPSNIFPGSTIRMTDATDPAFEWKLDAPAERGGAIVLTTRAIRYGKGPALPVTLFHLDPALWPNLYAHDPEACIDILFRDPPPPTLPPGLMPPNYCLGRCSIPPVVNTY